MFLFRAVPENRQPGGLPAELRLDGGAAAPELRADLRARHSNTDSDVSTHVFTGLISIVYFCPPRNEKNFGGAISWGVFGGSA